MFYEVKTVGLDQVGKEIKETYLVESSSMIEAISTACVESRTDDCESAKKSSIYEVVNEDDFDLENRFIAVVQTDGDKKKLKYKMFLYASCFDEAKQHIEEYLKQGYDGFELIELVNSSITKFIK